MVLPLSLLKSSQNQQMLIELKNGDTYIGEMVACDNWMNIHLQDAIFTSKDGDKFVKIKELFIRGPTIKLMHIPEEVMSAVNEEVVEVRKNNQQQRDNRFRRNNMGPNRGNGGRGRGGYRQYSNRDDNNHQGNQHQDQPRRDNRSGGNNDDSSSNMQHQQRQEYQNRQQQQQQYQPHQQGGNGGQRK
uniref:U6 snRNA-associated Sm-like protein LSm4 n=1 Tax=Panagrolaimus sp. ES5 TaxID=591445 RepID=A0AC34F2M6_9BILA